MMTAFSDTVLATNHGHSRRKRWQGIALMLAVGLAVRLATVLIAYGEQMSPDRGQFAFGWEAGRVARSLAAGQGFQSPLMGDTGPTAWLPPAYPLLLAAVFRVFGIYTAAAAIAILSLNGFLSALTVLPVYAIARRIWGDTVAAVAGWMWTLFPFAIFIGAFRVWSECLDGLLVSLVFLVALTQAATSRVTVWLGAGVLTGLAALNNPNTMSLVPALWGWAAWQRYQKSDRARQPLLGAILALLITVAPWFVRNAAAFGEVVPFRGNFWLEVYIGNTGETPVMLVDWNRHPASNTTEMSEYARRGERAYMKEKRHQALAFIAAHPFVFTVLTLRRMVFVWSGFWSWDRRYLASEPLQVPFIILQTSLSLLVMAGLRCAWRDRHSAVFLLAAMAICQPLVYYVTHPAVEYRHAIDPLLVVVAAAGFMDMRAWLSAKALGPWRILQTSRSRGERFRRVHATGAESCCNNFRGL